MKRPLLWPATALIVIFLIPCIYYFNVRPVLANYHAVTATVRLKEQPTIAKTYFEKAFSYSPSSEEEYRFILTQFTRDQIKLRGLTNETAPLALYAIDEMKKTIAANPNAIQDYLLLGELYLVADKLDEGYIQKAEDITFEALQRAPRRYQVYTLLGRINAQQGDVEKAVEYFKQAIALNKEFAEAYWNLGIMYILGHQFDLARIEIDRSQTHGFDPYTDANILKQFQAYKDTGILPAAIDFMKDVTRRFPDNTTYSEVLKELLRQQVSE